MKPGIAGKLLGVTKPTLASWTNNCGIKPERLKSGEIIYTWESLAKIKFAKEFSGIKINPKIISVCQNKGGVGKTTSVINLAWLFSYFSRVLVIDADSQSSLSQAFGDYYSEGEITLSDAFDNQENIQPAIKKINESLHILPNHLKFERWKKTAIKNQEGPEFSLKKLLKSVKHDYDFILIDTPPSLDLGLEMSLIASDYVIIPFQPEQMSLEGIENLVDEIRRIGEEDRTGGFNLEILGLFITMSQRDSLSKGIMDVILAEDEYKPFITQIRRAVVLMQSQSMKEPVFTFDEKSLSSVEYFNLGFEILNRIYKG